MSDTASSSESRSVLTRVLRFSDRNTPGLIEDTINSVLLEHSGFSLRDLKIQEHYPEHRQKMVTTIVLIFDRL